MIIMTPDVTAAARAGKSSRSDNIDPDTRLRRLPVGPAHTILPRRPYSSVVVTK